MKLKNYKIIGKPSSFQASNDKFAAVVVASIGDCGFVDRDGLDKFPATWTEAEWEMWLGCPLSEFLSENGKTIAPIVAALRS